MSQVVAYGYFEDHGALIVAEAFVRHLGLGDQLEPLGLFEVRRQAAAHAADASIRIGGVCKPGLDGAPG